MPNQPLNRAIIEKMDPNELNARWSEVSRWLQTSATQPVKQPWTDHGGDLTRDDLLQMSEEDVTREFPRVQSALTRLGTQNNDK